MAKKTVGPRSPSHHRRASREKPPTDLGSAPRTEAVVDSADDRPVEYREPPAVRTLRHEEIAEAAYHRFLRRGGSSGRDFDDWIEAERELWERR